MLKNYLLVAFRNLKRHKIYSLVNIAGLAIGMSAFILIALLLDYENNWDNFHPDFDRIHRVQVLAEYQNYTDEWTQTTFPVSTELRENYPEFEKVAVLREVWGELLSVDNEKVIHEKNGFYIEPNFFEIFNVKFIQGDKETALSLENSIIITDEFANRHFPDQDPLGKTLTASANGDLIVSAVVERWPEQSHIRPAYFLNFSRMERRYPHWLFKEKWDSFSFRVYGKLKPSAEPSIVSKKIRNILNDKIVENKKRLYLRPLNKLHMAARVEEELESPLPYYEYVAWFVLLLACINFVNLTTAKSAQREKEIGIRKVVGSSRFSLFKQFIGESTIITLISLVISFFIAELLLPSFNTIMQRKMDIDYLGNVEFMTFVVGMMVLIGFLSGIYPALYLSSFDPIKIIKGFTSFGNTSGSKGNIRRLLVGFQFIISISLIIMTYYIFNHVSYMKTKDLGFNEKNLIRIAIPNNENPHNFEDLRIRLLANLNVIDASMSDYTPFFGGGGRDVNWEGGAPEDKINCRNNSVTHSFVRTFGMDIVQGRNFSVSDRPNDNYVLVNETFVKTVGWDQPIGKTILDGEYNVVGVIKDFHNTSVHNIIEPYLTTLNEGNINHAHSLAININPFNKAKTVDEINEILREYYPNSLYQIIHYAERLDLNTYSVWEGVQITFGYFTFITICIAMIGIIGLLSFSVERKTKEIGIRKVLGASLNGLYLLINRDFFIIYLITLVFAIPLAIIVIDTTPGAYKYQMKVIDYIVPIITVAVLSLFATGFISVKAALNNPVNSLKDE